MNQYHLNQLRYKLIWSMYPFAFAFDNVRWCNVWIQGGYNALKDYEMLFGEERPWMHGQDGEGI